jgi:cyclase
MSYVRIMPALDIKDGRIVKGVNFVSLQDAGDPVTAAQAYMDDGADELTFLDITATVEKRGTTLDMVNKVASVISIPLTVGGGIACLSDAQRVLEAGAGRVCLSSAAYRNPGLIDELARCLGSARVVVAIDVDRSTATPSGYEAYIDGGRTATGKDAVIWAKEAAARGAGMILPTSKACDGAKEGYDIPLIRQLKSAVSIPIVASGGAGAPRHFLEAARAGADVLLAASVFHFGQIRISALKQYLQEQGIATGPLPK